MNRVNTLVNHLDNHQKTPSFTKKQILEKREEGLVWIVIKNNVYDVTEFLDEHPGGAELITDIAPDDFKTMTSEFIDAEHSEEAMEQLQTFFKGTLLDEGGSDFELEEEEEDHPFVEAPNHDPTHPFSGLTEVTLKLDSLEHLSHDVTVYRFALQNKLDEFSLPIGKHIVLSFEEMDGHHISRAYTPVSPCGDTGFVDFLIKHYPNGKMSSHLRELHPGHSTIQMKGPKGKLSYEGNGRFRIRRKGKEDTVKLSHIGMIAGGSGITPMFQIIQAVARNPQDELKISLLFANKSEEDMILKHPLNYFAQLRPNQIKITYTLDNPISSEWKGEKGFITADMIKRGLPPPSASSMIFLCGPPPMIKLACLPNLKKLGYTSESIFKF